ncbi:MAG: hypothetical protein J7L11_01480, partial [Thermoprotei archaeon]|nr:hypothetical protein [Thermoprotei archaeon]
KLRKILKSKGAMTGIETAIILIAFVIVAASFAFVVLNMGFFTAQRSKTVIGSGLSEASSAIEIDGSVIAHGVPENYVGTLPSDLSEAVKEDLSTLLEDYEYGFAYKVVVYIKLSSGRQPVELTRGKLVIAYTNPRVSIDNIYPEGTQSYLEDICKVEKVVGDDDMLLEEGEKFKIIINLGELYAHFGDVVSLMGISYMTDKGDIFVGTHETFTIEVKPPVGAILTIERMIPPAIDYVMNLS